MKTLVCFALLLGIVALASAEQPQYCPPGRVCRITPGLSDYSHSVLSSGYSPSRGGYYQNGSYYDNGHHRQRDVVRIVSVAQINPAYVSSYVPGAYDATTQADILGEIRRLGARIDQLNQLVGRPAATQPTTPAPIQPTLPLPLAPTMPGTPGSARVPVPDSKLIGLAVLNAKCAACHMTGKLLPEQRFTLLTAKGDLVSLTDKQKVSLSNKTRLGMMPPPSNSYGIPPLTDAEYAAVADLLGF